MDKAQAVALKKLILGLAGSTAVFIGTFGPLGKVPLLGGITAFDFHVAYGIFIILMAVASFILVLKEHYSALWITGLVILGFVVVPPPVYMLILQLYPVGNGPFSAFTQLVGQVVSLAWGWGVLLAGGILLMSSAGIKQKALYYSAKGKGVEIGKREEEIRKEEKGPATLEKLLGRVVTIKEFVQNMERIGELTVKVKGIVKNVEITGSNTYFTLTDEKGNRFEVRWKGKHDISEDMEVIAKGQYSSYRTEFHAEFVFIESVD